MQTGGNRDAILSAWKDAKTELDFAKDREAELRRQVITAFSEITDPSFSGTETLNIGWGFALKIEHKITHELASDEQIDQIKVRIVWAHENGNEIVNKLFRTETKLSVSVLKTLPDYLRSIVDEVISIKPATKTLKLVGLKES